LSSPQRSYAIIFLLFLLSGATGLIYEVIWLRQLVLIFGSTQFATSTILSTFMGGLALGAFLAGRWTGGTRIPPLRLYGLLELGIGLYALAVPFLFSSLTPIYRVIWQAGASESFVLLSLAKFAGIALVLLPPTTLMGASLPILARQVADDEERIGGKVGGLYAINIVGAVVGVFIAGFILIPKIGVHTSIWITAVTNLLLGIVAIALARGISLPGTVQEAEAHAPSGAPRSLRVRLALVVFALSGFGALVLEVAWTRVLVLVVGSSVYAFSLMLLAFLIGLAAGGGALSAVLRRRPSADPARLLLILLAASGLLAYASAFLFQYLPPLFAKVFIELDPSPAGWFAWQFAGGMLIMFPTTFALGGVFPCVLQIHARSLSQVAGSVGTVYAANTVGTIVGAGLAGFVLIPSIGVKDTVVLIALTQLVLALVVALVMIVDRRGPRLAGALSVGALLIVMFLARPTWDVLLMNSGVFNLFGQAEGTTWSEYMEWADETELLYEAEGLTAHVFVADERKADNRFLSVNGKVEASSNVDLETQILSSHLPLLVHDDPKDVMIIGLASGITAGAAAVHPVESIRILEIETKMEPAARLFAEFNHDVLDDERVTISYNDARNELEFSPMSYDVIISEPSNPWMTIAANLFTEEFFRMARTRVRPGGIYCQWIQNYYLPAEDLRSIAAAFHASFPHILLFETVDGVDLLLLGSDTPLSLNLERMDYRLSDLWVRADLSRVGLRDSADILSTFRLGDREVTRLVEGAARNTDDNARVEFSAPKSLGSETITDNLVMLRRFTGDPLNYLDPPLEDQAASDELRVSIAEAMLRRGNHDLALQQARQVGEGPHKARATKILSLLAAESSGN